MLLLGMKKKEKTYDLIRLRRAWKQTTAPKKKAIEKNPAAVALGRLGGLKGGKARAESYRKEAQRNSAESC